MTEITAKMTLGDVATLPELKAYKNAIKYDGGELYLDSENGDKEFFTTFEDNTYQGALALKGTSFLLKMVQKNRSSIYNLYSEEEIKAYPQKRFVSLMRFTPDTIDENKPYIFLCSGGAYICVCHHVEALPTAEHFVDAGYQVFALTYRVRAEEGSLPAALEDIDVALKFITAHQDEFKLKGNNYVIGGYSAGGNLICTWGTKNAGYKKFNAPKPKAMLPIYAPVGYEEVDYSNRDNFYMVGKLGKDFSEEKMKPYLILENIDKDYPPCFIICGKADQVVSCKNSEILKEKLDEVGVAAVLEETENDPHGFGDGTGFEAEGWPMRAIKFIENLN